MKQQPLEYSKDRRPLIQVLSASLAAAIALVVLLAAILLAAGGSL